jgi:hypothetical protein
MGFASFFVFLPVAQFLPSLTAVVSTMAGLLVIGLWFLVYSAETAQKNRLILILAATLLLPLGTLVSDGFLGYGTVWSLGVMAFYFVTARRRVWIYVATPVVIFLGLSLFVTYMQQRNEIRDLIWYQKAGMMQRLGQVSRLVTDFQLLDLSNPQHLRALDERLNQNYLVGVGVMRHREGEVELWYGGTVPLWALIPRALWPDKPGIGGGKNLASEFTGITFAEGTSVGAGQVLEFYMNFGMPGVLAGFAVFGFILMRLDQRMMRAFARGDSPGVLQTALPGLVMLQPLGNLLEIVVAVASAIIFSRLLVPLGIVGFRPRTERLNSKMPRTTVRMIERQ